MKEYNGQDVTKMTVGEIDRLCKSVYPLHAGIIYCYTNKINDKKYIGQTRNPVSRHGDHKHAINDTNTYTSVFYLALRKYGMENFDYQVLSFVVCDSIEELALQLDKEEYDLIKLYKTKSKQNGYNIKNGGSHIPAFHLSNYAKPVDQYTLDGQFVASYESIKEAIYATGFSKISSAVSDISRRQFTGGYLWCNKGEKPLQENINYYASHSYAMYSLDGQFLRLFYPLKAAINFVVGTVNPPCSEESVRATILVATKHYKTRNAFGFRWTKGKKEKLNDDYKTKYRRIHKFDKNGNIVATFISITEAAKHSNLTYSSFNHFLYTRGVVQDGEYYYKRA